jgi:glycerophosphoryl diester phosphodiesterase
LRAGAVAAVLVVVAAAAVASSGGVAARPLVGEGGGGAWGQDSRAPLQTSRAFNIAHRGSNGELPEETAAAYARAIDEGADFIEADIEATSDGHLVCFHDTTLDDTTDVADHPEFAGRRRTLEVQWANVTGYFISTCTFRTVCHHSAQCSDFISSYRCVDRKHRLYNPKHMFLNLDYIIAADFTLAELKTLRAKQRWDFRDKSHDGERRRVRRPAIKSQFRRTMCVTDNLVKRSHFPRRHFADHHVRGVHRHRPERQEGGRDLP